MTKKLAYLTLASAALIGFSVQTETFQNTTVSAQENLSTKKVPITVNYIDDYTGDQVYTSSEEVTQGSTIYISNFRGVLIPYESYGLKDPDEHVSNVQANQVIDVKVLKAFRVPILFVDEFGNSVGDYTAYVTRGDKLSKSDYDMAVNSLSPLYEMTNSNLPVTEKIITTDDPITLSVVRKKTDSSTKLIFVDNKGTTIATEYASGKLFSTSHVKLPEGYVIDDEGNFISSIDVNNDGEERKITVSKTLHIPITVADETGKVLLKSMLNTVVGYHVKYPELPEHYQYVNTNLSDSDDDNNQALQDEKPVNLTAIDRSKFTHITYNDPAGNELGDKYIKDSGNGTINISTNVPAGYHLSSQQPAVIPAHNDEDWSVLVSNQPETNFVSTVTTDPVQPSQSTSQPTKSTTDIEKMNGTATITAKAGTLVFGDADTTKQLDSNLPVGSKWRVFSVRRDNGDTYSYNLGGGQWIKASDALINDTPVAKPIPGSKESKTSGTFVVRIPGKPKWSTVLWTANGKATSKFLKAGSPWKTLAKKTINGHIYYRLGSQKQWVRADYGYLK